MAVSAVANAQTPNKKKSVQEGEHKVLYNGVQKNESLCAVKAPRISARTDLWRKKTMNGTSGTIGRFVNKGAVPGD